MISETTGGRDNPGSPPMKICYGCAEYKPTWEFHRSKRSKDGRRARCKDCSALSAAVSNASKRSREQTAQCNDDSGTKRCARCGETKSREDFYRHKKNSDGLRGWCKACDIESAKAGDKRRREARRTEYLEQVEAGAVPAGKLCKVCKETKPRSGFYPHSRALDGCNSVCKECMLARRRTGRAERQHIARQRKRKECSGCGEVKLRSEFDESAKMFDGLKSKCRECLADALVAKRCPGCGEDKTIGEFYRDCDAADGASTYCMICISRRHKDYRKRNPEKKREGNARHYRENKERYAELSRQWRTTNRERKRETDREWEKSNRERVRANRRKWRANWSEERREQEAQYRREWRKQNPEKARAIFHKRLARTRAAEGNFTAEQWKAVLDFYEHTCLCCGEQGKVTVDHVVPLARGGSNGIENLQPLCQSCNSRKNATTIDYRDPYLHEQLLEAMAALGMLAA